MRRLLLLLLPVLLVIAALVAARGCGETTTGAQPTVPRVSTPLAAPVAPSVDSAGGTERRRVVQVPRDVAAGDASDVSRISEGFADVHVVRGRVVYADGSPARGRSVRVLVNTANSTFPSGRLTDHDGRFEAPAVEFLSHSVEVSVPLDDLHQVTLDLPEVDAGDDVRFVIPRRAPVTGTLVTAGGSPLPNVLLVARTSAITLDDGVRMRPVRIERRTLSPAADGTSPEGHFTLPLLEGMRAALSIPEHPTLTLIDPPTLLAGMQDVVLVAGEGAAIAGVCVDEHGEPLEGAGVFALGEEHERVAGADADGRFRVTGLVRGATYTLQGRRHGWMASDEQRIAAGTTGVRLELVKGRTIAGTMSSGEGALQGDGTLVLSGTFRGSTITHEIPVNGGRFILRGVVGDDLRATFRPRDGDEVRLGALPPSGSDRRIQIRLPD